MRPRRVVWLAWRDLRLVLSGRSWWKLPVVALLLLVPAGAIPVEAPDVGQTTAKVRGDIPAALEGRVVRSDRALVRLVDGDPVVARGNRIPAVLRQELDTLGGPRVEVRDLAPERRLPGRSLLVALLALSLLTGPLTESTAGERRRKTLDALMSAGISRFELVAGKWLAWTGAATVATGAVAIAGLLSGSQQTGWWPLGLPLVAGVAVALALWLQRHADDEVGAAARTMRVVPIAAMVAGATAWMVAQEASWLGALVPLGGALLLAGDVLAGPLDALMAALGSVVAIGVALAWTARDLDRVTRRPTGRVGVLVTAVALWWLPVVGPQVWELAGNAELTQELSVSASHWTAGGLALGLALVLGLRHGLAWWPRRLGWLFVAPWVGAGLAQMPLDESRLSLALVAVPALVGQELLFRGALTRISGPWLAGAAWVLACAPHAPIQGVVAAVALGLLAHRGGWPAAVCAHVVWALSTP